jgi:hypothetical protein
LQRKKVVFDIIAATFWGLLMQSISRLFAHGVLLSGLIVSGSCTVALAQAVGSHVECSPTSMASSWWPGTVIKVDAAGNCTVRLDQREGYAPNEEYFVPKKWVRAAAAAPANAGEAGGAGNQAANAPGGDFNAPPAAGNATQKGGEFAVGTRVRANNIHTPGEAHWHNGTISRMISPGLYAVHFDHNGLTLVVKQEWIKAGTGAPTVVPGQGGQNNGNQNGAGQNAAQNQTPANNSKGKGAPPDGLYQCNMISGGMYIHIGTLEIRGGTYRGLNKGAASHPFSVDGAGNMSLSQGLAGMPDGFTLKSVSYVGADHVGRPLIKIRYIGASNAHDTIDAVRE